MAVKLYDQALLSKFKAWIKDPHMTITGPNETERLFAEYADKTNDKPITLPLIALRRTPDIQILSHGKNPMSFDGKHFTIKEYDPETQEENVKLGHVDAIPITLHYQLDIYCRYLAEADEYFRNFLFGMINHPTVNIELNYNGITIPQKSFIIVGDQVSDNSDIPERLVAGQFTRYTIPFDIDHAYLYSTEIVEPLAFQIYALIDDKDRIGNEEARELLTYINDEN